MTRRLVLAASAAFCALTPAQQTPDITKLSADSAAAYKTWRERDPKLESEVRTAAKATLDARILRSADDAQKMTIARHELADAAFQAAKNALDALDKDLGTPVLDLQLAALQRQQKQLEQDASLLDRNIKVFAADKDPGIQKVKTEMEKERTAMNAVRDALAGEEKTLTALKLIGDRGEAARTPAVGRYGELMSAARQDRDRIENESALWQAYYQALGKVAPAEVSKTTIAPGNPREETTRVPVLRPGRESTVPPKSGVPPIVADASRWTGAWTYPPTNGLFSGEEPESAEIIVREQDGQLVGTLNARFRLQKGVLRDPVLRIDFNGPLTATRTLKMTAVTADRVTGTLELLPGSAGNLIEVSWQLGASQPSKALPKVRQGGMVLWKK